LECARWLSVELAIWTNEKIIELFRYGTAVDASDPAERCTLLWHRWKLEKAKELKKAALRLQEQGLKTIALFREENAIDFRDLLSFARLASQCAMEAGEHRTRVYTRKGMRRAYSDSVLADALARLQPHLPWPEETQMAG
jgi:hypothetical protein